MSPHVVEESAATFRISLLSGSLLVLQKFRGIRAHTTRPGGVGVNKIFPLEKCTSPRLVPARLNCGRTFKMVYF